MMTPVMDVALFRKGPDGQTPLWERQRSQKALLWMMEALCRINQDIIKVQKKLGKPVPLMYGADIHYQREDGQEWWKQGTELESKPTELWQDIYTTIARKGGDCEDLACWRIAELRETFGRQAKPLVTYRVADGAYHFHALLWVMGPDGWRKEDPSDKLGMNWENRFSTLPQADRDKEYLARDAKQKTDSPALLARFKEVG